MNDFELFNSLLRLDPETGHLYWRVRNGKNCRFGVPAGSTGKEGYVCIQVNRKIYKAHRIVWLLVYGEWPKQEIDHINRKRNDNRPINLRDVSKSQNQLNNPYPNGLTRTGHKGIYPLRSGRYQVQIQGRILGSFTSLETAIEVRRKAWENALEI